MSDATRGLHLHVDCASGAAGDMLLGALLDLGVPLGVVGDALDAVGAGRDKLRAQRVVKHGISATDVKVVLDDGDGGGRVVEAIAEPATRSRPYAVPKNASGSFVAIKFRAEDHEHHVHVDEHGDKRVHRHSTASDATVAAAPAAALASAPHAHGHAGHAPHVAYVEIRRRIEAARLPDGVRVRALDIFDRIARAEAKLHGTTVDAVQFHEVGALDSIVDVVGCAAALDWLRPTAMTCTGVAMGHGTLTCAHGVLPVPAPAALEILREAGGVMLDGGVSRELCTPTGAAVLAASVTAWQPAPPARPVAIGWGAGDAELEDRANVVRVVALATVPGIAAAAEVWQIDANVDDMSPELCAPAADAIFAAGALDVWWTPVSMKKGRPALVLSALADDGARDRVIAAILRETTTIGVRFAPRQRTVLARTTVEVTTKYGKIPVKLALDADGATVRNAAPEYEACAAAARQHGVPVKLVFAAALAAYDRG